jgi:hypothetical protein
VRSEEWGVGFSIRFATRSDGGVLAGDFETSSE